MSANNWNPNSPATKGLEWAPLTSSSITLDSGTKSAAMSLIQSSADVIANERIYVSALPTRGGIYAVEVYDAENGVPAGSPTNSSLAKPNSDISIGPWLDQSGGAVNLYSVLADGGDFFVYDPTYIQCVPPSAGAGGATYRGHIDATMLGSLTGKRILGIYFNSQVGEHFDGPNYAGTMGLTIAGVDVPVGTCSGGGGATQQSGALLTYNPATKKPWTIADITSLTSTANYGWYINISSDGSGSGYVQIYWMRFAVITIDETRLAFGSLNDSASGLTAGAWNDAPVLTPTGGAWTKDASGSHLYTLRRISATGSLVIPTLMGTAAPTSVGEGFSPTLDPTYGYVTAMGAATPTLFGLIQRTSGPANSTDSQCYVYPAGWEGVSTLNKVYNGQASQQEFSNASATDYGIISAYVNPNLAVGDLLIKIKKRSDDSQLGSTITVTAAEAAALPNAGNGWKLIQRQLAVPATLAGATQYYIEFSDNNAADDGTFGVSLGVNHAAAWTILTLDDAGQGADTGFGGTTDRATVGGSEQDKYDVYATFATVPLAPTSFAAAVQQLALATPTPPSKGCEVDYVEFTHLTWTVTSLGGSFTRYEIDRSDDGGTTWDNVAQLTSESLAYWDDYEGKRGVLESYRIRVVRTDGASSGYSSTVTSTCSSEYCELIFTTNSSKDLTVAYGHPAQGAYSGSVGGGNGTYTVLDAGAMVLTSMYGRNRQVAFVPTERLGVTFDTDIYINWVATPIARGVAAFNALRTLAEAQGLTVPYICVLDHEGNRFYAALQIKQGLVLQPGNQQVVTVTVTEVRDGPLAVVVAFV